MVGARPGFVHVVRCPHAKAKNPLTNVGAGKSSLDSISSQLQLGTPKCAFTPQRVAPLNFRAKPTNTQQGTGVRGCTSHAVRQS